jgi:hypothetical protein
MSVYYTNVVDRFAEEFVLSDHAVREIKGLVSSANIGGYAEGRKEIPANKQPHGVESVKRTTHEWIEFYEQRLRELRTRLEAYGDDFIGSIASMISINEGYLLRQKRKAEGCCEWCGAKKIQEASSHAR